MHIKPNKGKFLSSLCINDLSNKYEKYDNGYEKYDNGYIGFGDSFCSTAAYENQLQILHPATDIHITRHETILFATDFNKITDRYKVNKVGFIEQIYKVIHISDPNIWNYNYPILLYDNSNSYNAVAINGNTKVNLAIPDLKIKEYIYVAEVFNLGFCNQITIIPDKLNTTWDFIFGWNEADVSI